MKSLPEIRRFTFYFVAAIVTITMAIVCFPLVFSRRLNIGLARCWIKVILWLLKWICRIDVRVIGKENIPKDSFMVASKHQSALETLIYPLLFPYPIFILKKSIFFIPIMGAALKSARAIYIDRSKGRDAILSIQKQLKDLSSKYSPVIFPEGTRTKAGVWTEQYRSGAALIYEALDYRVVPIAVDTGIFWPKSGPMRSGTATIKILPPMIATKNYDRKQFLKQLNEIIESHSMELYKNTLSKHKLED